MIIPTFPSLATVTRRANHRLRTYLHAKYGWNTLGEQPSDFNPEAAAECQAANLQQRILPNGKTYSQSDTIDKMVFGVHGLEFQTMSPIARSDSSTLHLNA